MKKEMRVSRKWQGSKNVPAISLQGLYLKEHGFDIDDFVKIDFYQNEIRIRKMTPEMIYNDMKERNPALIKLISEFDCVISE